MPDTRWKAIARQRDDQPDVESQAGQQQLQTTRRVLARKGEELPWDELLPEDQANLRAAGQGPRDAEPAGSD